MNRFMSPEMFDAAARRVVARGTAVGDHDVARRATRFAYELDCISDSVDLLLARLEGIRGTDVFNDENVPQLRRAA